jgi:hypothetical protein
MGRDQGGRMRCRICRGDMDRRGEGEGVFRVVVRWSVVVYECPSAVESSGSGSGRGGEARARAVPASEVWLWFSLALALLHVLDKTKDRLCLFFLTCFFSAYYNYGMLTRPVYFTWTSSYDGNLVLLSGSTMFSTPTD